MHREGGEYGFLEAFLGILCARTCVLSPYRFGNYYFDLSLEYKMRLDRFLSDMGVLTRSQCKKEVRGGMISVNGAVAQKSDLSIDPDKDEIRYRGELIEYQRYTYLMLNKPQGYLSATESAVWAFVTSILRGVVGITLCALIMSNLFGMNGIWLAFATSECITSVIAIIAIKRNLLLLKL